MLVVLQMRESIFNDGNNYLVISSDIKNYTQLLKNLKNMNRFQGVWFYKIKKRSKIRNFQLAVFGKNICKFPRNLIINDFYSFNFDLSAHILFAFLERKNKNISTHRFEEGVLSYSVPFDDSNFLNKVYSIRRKFKKKNARLICDGFYCFFPKLYNGNLEPFKVPAFDLNDNEKNKIILGSFGISPLNELNDSIRIIYLSSVYNVDGDGRIDENLIVSEIGNIVSPLVVEVKSHPRDIGNSFANHFQPDNVPVELLPLLFKDPSKLILVSSFSGSLLNVASLFAGAIASIYTTRLCDCSNNSLARHFSDIIINLSSSEHFNKLLFLCNDLKEFITIINRIIETRGN